MHQRIIEPEWLDHATDAEVDANLRDLRFLNRWFGAHGILRDCLRAIPAPRTILDVGAASGDMGRIAAQVHPQASVISLDLQARNLQRATAPRVAADAFALPFADDAVDAVMANLFLHHFTNAQVVQLLRGFHRVARHAVIIQDLQRHTIAHKFLPATSWLFRWNDITLHDGPVSVAAGFTSNELDALAHEAGWRKRRVRQHGLAFRLSAILLK